MVCLLGRFDFEKISKLVLHLIGTSRTKIRINISVQHQDSCIVVGQRLCYSDNNKNEVYVKIIDDFYAIGGGT